MHSVSTIFQYGKSIKKVISQAKSNIVRLSLSFPHYVECNVCGWQGRRFISDEWHSYTICPNCHLEVRHRLLVAALTHIAGLSWTDIVRHKRILHFAPEDKIKYRLQYYAAKYVTADLLNPQADLNLDISNLRSLGAEQYDLVIACDVLEHVPDDVQAIEEIYRIISPGGFAILTVPQKDNLEKTLEDPTAVTPADRQRLFGLAEHLRIYGHDFPARLESVGFKVTMVSERNFSDDLVKKHILFPPVLSLRPLATNYRKVFFAQKPLN